MMIDLNPNISAITLNLNREASIKDGNFEPELKTMIKQKSSYMLLAKDTS